MFAVQRVQLRAPQYTPLGSRTVPFMPRIDLKQGTLKPCRIDAKLDDVSAIVADLEEDEVSFSGHVIVCGTGANLIHFIRYVFNLSLHEKSVVVCVSVPVCMSV